MKRCMVLEKFSPWWMIGSWGIIEIFEFADQPGSALHVNACGADERSR